MRAIELLALQASPYVTFGCTASGDRTLWIGDRVRAELAAELRAVHAAMPHASLPDRPPPALARCEQLTGWLRSSGPVYAIPPATTFASDVHLERDPERLAGANPGNWHPVEWRELLDGRLGPWAIATVDGRVASICHTPSPLTPEAAECGVWTDPAFRGRGHASATVVAWIPQVAGRALFYSHDAANHASRRVAQRLALPLLGWTWRLGPPPPKLHPLCSVDAS